MKYTLQLKEQKMDKVCFVNVVIIELDENQEIEFTKRNYKKIIKIIKISKNNLT